VDLKENSPGNAGGGCPVLPEQPKRGMAVASLVLGILSCPFFCMLFGIPAIILGHIAHGRAKKSPAQYAGGGLAVAGLVMGYVSLPLNLFVLPILLAMLLPALAAAKIKAQQINSINNLKQIGTAFHQWENEHNGQYPFNLSQAQGGTRELCQPDRNGFEQNPVPTFMILSNELSNPLILICPNDPAKHAAPNFASLTAENISYELRTGPDVNDRHPQEILAVDAINGFVLHCDGSVERDLQYKRKN
jgi:hypothetical protein